MNNNINFSYVLRQRPQAFANIIGSPDYPNIKGNALFYQTKYGVIVAVKLFGLPKSSNICRQPIFAFHIHSGGSCTGNETDYFSDSGRKRTYSCVEYDNRN